MEGVAACFPCLPQESKGVQPLCHMMFLQSRGKHSFIWHGFGSLFCARLAITRLDCQATSFFGSFLPHPLCFLRFLCFLGFPAFSGLRPRATDFSQCKTIYSTNSLKSPPCPMTTPSLTPPPGRGIGFFGTWLSTPPAGVCRSEGAYDQPPWLGVAGNWSVGRGGFCNLIAKMQQMLKACGSQGGRPGPAQLTIWWLGGQAQPVGPAQPAPKIFL